MNFAKHGVSLARAAELDVFARIVDERFDEPRYRAFGLLEGLPYCLAYAVRDGSVRDISLRHAHLKEFRRYAR